MSFTSLQKLALERASELASQAMDQLHKVARERGFGNELCTFNTVENDLSQNIRKIHELVKALQNEN